MTHQGRLPGVLPEQCVMLVTGGRDFKPDNAMRGRLLAEFDERRPVTLIQGGAPGADMWAASMAARRTIPVHKMPALWHVQGRRAAGIKRNIRMLAYALTLGTELDLPVVLLAFPGDTGTADMTKRAAAAGCTVVQVGMVSG